MEITYKDKTYKFKAGIGFYKEIQKLAGRNFDGVDFRMNTGLTIYVALLQSYDVEAIEKVLLLMNKNAGGTQLTTAVCDAYLEDDSTDIEQLVTDILDFLSNANVCKKAVREALAAAQAAVQMQA